MAADGVPATVAQLIQLKEAWTRAANLERGARADELHGRLLAAAEASQPADSLIIASLLRGAVSARLAAISTQSGASDTAEAARRAWRSDGVLTSSRRCLALLNVRARKGTLWTLTPDEAAYMHGDPRTAELLGGEALFACARDAVRWWPRTRADEEERVAGVLGALRALLARDATGALERSPTTGRLWEIESGPTFGWVVQNLLDVTLSAENFDGSRNTTLAQLRGATRDALTAREEAALRAVQARVSNTAPDVGAWDAPASVLMAARMARAQADVARHGLRACALPSCGATEPQPKAFKVCSRCRKAAYCSPQHQAEDWKRHKRADGCTTAASG
jgi:hypothetical protein